MDHFLFTAVDVPEDALTDDDDDDNEQGGGGGSPASDSTTILQQIVIDMGQMANRMADNLGLPRLEIPELAETKGEKRPSGKGGKSRSGGGKAGKRVSTAVGKPENPASPPYDHNELMIEIDLLSQDEEALLERLREISFDHAEYRLPQMDKRRLAAWLLWWVCLPAHKRRNYHSPAGWVCKCLRNGSWPLDLEDLWEREGVRVATAVGPLAHPESRPAPSPLAKLWSQLLADLKTRDGPGHLYPYFWRLEAGGGR